MKLRYRELIGKQVVCADGSHAGRLATLLAEPRDGTLRVTTLVVGTAGRMERIGLGTGTARHIPWSAIDRIDRHIHLKDEGQGQT